MRSWDHEWALALRNLELAIDIPEEARVAGNIVRKQYESPSRIYHNIDHIFHGLDMIDRFEAETKTQVMPQVRYCWLNHDSKNDPTATDNEECSAFLACAIVDSIFPKDAIMSTKLGYSGTSIAGRIIRDVDWSYFGSSYEEFTHITSLVRQEYAHLTDDEFKFGRKMFLEALDPDEIFWHPFFKKNYDKQAKENIEKAIQELT